MRLLLALAALLGVALFAACGGDDDDGDAEPTGLFTPAGTKDATETPAPVDGNGGVAPEPADPQLDEQLQEVTAGELDATIQPGERYQIDPLAITEAAVGSSPACANFAFDFTWQVQDPFPPEGVQLVWEFTRMGGTVEVANGPAGEQSIGCGLLEAVNRGPAAITVAVRYRVGVIQ
jgi:hypothetical protein